MMKECTVQFNKESKVFCFQKEGSKGGRNSKLLQFSTSSLGRHGKDARREVGE